MGLELAVGATAICCWGGFRSIIPIAMIIIGAQHLGTKDLGHKDLGQMDLGQKDLGQKDIGQMDIGHQNIKGPMSVKYLIVKRNTV